MAGAVGAVVRGRGDRLFLGRQDGFDLGRFTNGSALPPFLLAQWRATLVRRGRELSARGVPYVFIIAPDAPSVHFEELPDDYPGPYRMPGRAFLDAMGDIPGVTFVYPVDALRAARGGLDVYQRTDSHWTMFGSGVAHRELLRAAAPLLRCRLVPPAPPSFSFRASYGDLGSLCEPERRSEVPIASFDGPEPDRILDCSGAQRQTATATRMPGAAAVRALAFRDSFMTDLAPYMARTFGDLLTVGTTTRVLLDAVDDWAADIVFSEVAERRLVAFETDHQPHPYRWLYLAEHSGEHGKAMLRALTTLQSDPAGAATIVRSSAEDFMDDPTHAYSAAVILEAAGDPDGAAPFAARALAADQANTGALALCAKLRLATGRPGEAVALLARAVETAPWNGALRELHVYALIQHSQPVAASLAAEAAIGTIDDLGNLWYWVAILREASGKPAAAAEAIAKALVLDPENAVYLGLAHRTGTIR